MAAPAPATPIDPFSDDYSERELARRNLRDFVPYVNVLQGGVDYVVNPFGTMLADVCQQFIEECVAGMSPRYMVFAPPRHGKSETVSRQLPAWALGRYPHLWFVGASYSPDLALSMSRDVQPVMDSEAYGRVFPSVKLPRKGGRDEKRTDKPQVRIAPQRPSGSSPGATCVTSFRT